MPESPLLPFIGTLRIVVYVQDEVEANLTMDRLRLECEELLDEEDGDEVLMTQIIPFTTDVSPEETLTILKRARNALIRTRIKQCWDTARDLDMTIHTLSMQVDPEYPANYDYSKLLEISERILHKKEEPNE